MTTIIMRTSDDNRGQLFFGLIPRFSILGKPACHTRCSTRHLQAPKNNLILLCISAASTHTKEACECSCDLSQMAKPLDQIDERLFLLFHAV